MVQFGPSAGIKLWIIWYIFSNTCCLDLDFTRALCVFQSSAAGLQCGHGLHHRGPPDVELWGGGDDLHPLEGTALPSAGLSHCYLGPDGPHLHQVPPRLDHLGGAGCHGCLGWVNYSCHAWIPTSSVTDMALFRNDFCICEILNYFFQSSNLIYSDFTLDSFKWWNHWNLKKNYND